MPRRSSLARLPATVALTVWTVLVWTTRINNIWTDDALDTGAKAGRTALALSFTVLAAATAVGLLQRRKADIAWLRPVVTAFAAWTVVVWVVRAVQIAGADHSAAFVAVHLVLAVTSTALAALAAREVASPDRTGQPTGHAPVR